MLSGFTSRIFASEWISVLLAVYFCAFMDKICMHTFIKYVCVCAYTEPTLGFIRLLPGSLHVGLLQMLPEPNFWGSAPKRCPKAPISATFMGT